MSKFNPQCVCVCVCVCNYTHVFLRLDVRARHRQECSAAETCHLIVGTRYNGELAQLTTLFRLYRHTFFYLSSCCCHCCSPCCLLTHYCFLYTYISYIIILSLFLSLSLTACCDCCLCLSLWPLLSFDTHPMSPPYFGLSVLGARKGRKGVSLVFIIQSRNPRIESKEKKKKNLENKRERKDNQKIPSFRVLYVTQQLLFFFCVCYILMKLTQTNASTEQLCIDCYCSSLSTTQQI